MAAARQICAGSSIGAARIFSFPFVREWRLTVKDFTKAAALRRAFCRALRASIRGYAERRRVSRNADISRGVLRKTLKRGRRLKPQGRILRAFFGPACFPALAPGATMEDLNPPSTFLVSLDAPMDGFATDASAFFGSGGVEHPSGLTSKLTMISSSNRQASAFLLEREFELAA